MTQEDAPAWICTFPVTGAALLAVGGCFRIYQRLGLGAEDLITYEHLPAVIVPPALALGLGVFVWFLGGNVLEKLLHKTIRR